MLKVNKKNSSKELKVNNMFKVKNEDTKWRQMMSS